jgi:peptide/nickel transport system permease protein
LCSLAGPYAHDIAKTGPNDNHLGETFVRDGKQVQVVSKGGFIGGEFKAGGIPVGPQLWHAGGKYVFGADTQGRDVAVRLLYGGINSLKVGIGSALICTLFALVLALLAGYYGGWLDWIISRFFDLIWAFPVLLLAIALGTALSINGFHHFGISIASGSLWIPTLVISYVLIPYIGRPLRGQILSLREKEFIEAATAQGAGGIRVMFSELLPNIASSVLVFFALIIANNILTEAGLSFLGAGVQPPNPSWGTLIADGQSRIQTAPWLAIIPGIAIVLTVLALNIFGDGLRDALDPRAKVRMEH